MIKAIIFDCFGVLTTDGWIAFKKRHFRDNAALADKASELNNVAGTGEISYGEFIEQVAKMAGITDSETQREIESNVADEELFNYIKTLKPKYKIGMLSNAAANHLKQLFTSEQVAVFDTVVLSYDSGVIKPEQQAYELAAERLGVQTTECIFVDDQVKHVEGARRSGMKTVLYENFDQMRKELEKTLSASANN